MIGTYTVIDPSGRELSESDSYAAARDAIRCHLLADKEDGPLVIVAPDGKTICSGDLDDCGRVLFRTTQGTSRKYEEVVKIWGRPE